MADFVVNAHGELITLGARNDRARQRVSRLPEAKSLPSTTDRILLRRDRARDVVGELKFEGYSIKGEEVI